jgi:sulfoxide reductase heme-binding subunit YedZ
MKRSTLILLKTLTWLACLGPVALLAYQAATNTLGPDPTSNIELTTGYNTLLLLILSLAVTPLRKLVPQLNWLIKFRRLLGLFAFFYGTMHLLTYVALYAGFDVPSMIADVAKRRFITMGVAAWLLLVPLALTSTNWAAQDCLPRGHLRRHSLLVAGEAGGTQSAAPHGGAGSPAAGAACAVVVAKAGSAGGHGIENFSASAQTGSNTKADCETGLKVLRWSGVGPSRARAERCSGAP